MYRIIYVDYDCEEKLNEKQAKQKFGVKEWEEIKANCFPHIIVVDG